MDKYTFGIGVQCIVLLNEKLLLGKRYKIYGDGSWGLPGGRLERGETIFDAARRELEEETGLVAKDLQIIGISDPTKENNYFLQIGVLVNSWHGEPCILEPDRCSEIGFFLLDQLPEPIFVGSARLVQIIQLSPEKNFCVENSKCPDNEKKTSN